MEYFSISQMENIPNTVELHLKTDKGYEKQQIIKKEDAKNIADSTVLYVTTNKNNFYPDLIDSPVLLVSDDLKKVLQAYTNDLVFKCVAVTDYYEAVQEIYWLMLMDEVDCISDKSTFKKDDTVEELILDKAKIGNKKIFRVANLSEKIVIVNFDISESMLRREFWGIEFKHIKTV